MYRVTIFTVVFVLVLLSHFSFAVTPVMAQTQDSAPPKFDNFQPSDWQTSGQTIVIHVEVEDLERPFSGLDPSTVEFEISDDGGQNWQGWQPLEVNFQEAVPLATLSVTVDFGRDSEDVYFHDVAQTQIRFRLADMAGNIAESSAYQVHIDNEPPLIDFINSSTHQPNVPSVNRQIYANWLPIENSSGLAETSLAWLPPAQLNQSDCPTQPNLPTTTTTSLSAVSPVLPDGTYYLCLWLEDNAGHISPKGYQGGPYIINATAPPAVLALTAQGGVSRWTNDPQIIMEWQAPSANDLAGYAVVWDQVPNTVPTATTLVNSTSYSYQLPSEGDGYYFHVAAVDTAGSRGPTTHFGPLGLDTVPPPDAMQFSPASDWVPADFTVQWNPGTTSGSPIVGHSYLFSKNRSALPDETVDTMNATAQAAGFARGDVLWLHVRGVDAAGNWSHAVRSGPYQVTTMAPGCAIGGVEGPHLISEAGVFWQVSLRKAFRVGWTDVVRLGQAPAHMVDVQVREGTNGQWTTVHSNISTAEFTFQGDIGETYFFRCRAIDVVGNIGAWGGASMGILVEIPDLQVTGIEVTQGIQDVNNSIPLVEDKTMWVRVSLQTNGTVTLPEGFVSLRAFRSSGVQMTPLFVGPVRILPSGSDRLDNTTTADFQLPTGWTYDKLNFVAEVNPVVPSGIGRIYDEMDLTNNRFTSTPFFFERKRPLNMTFLRINNIFTPTMPFLPAAGTEVSLLPYSEAILPIPHINVVPTPGSDILNFSGDLTLENDWVELLNQIWLRRLLATGCESSDLNGRCDVRWYGMSNVPNVGLAFGGLAAVNGSAGVGQVNMDSSDQLMAHEVMHNLGRRHAPCSPGAIDNVDPNYPSADASIGEVGFDTRNGFVYRPETKSVMSYCGPPAWISPYTYRALFQEMSLAASGVRLAALEMGPHEAEHLVISGVIDEMANHVAFNPLYRAVMPIGSASTGTSEPASGHEPPQLAFYDAAGKLLRLQPLDVDHSHGAADFVPMKHFFSTTIVDSPDIAVIVLTHHGQEIGRLEASKTAPEVELAEMKLEVLDGEITAVWQASDVDGDTLTYDLLYSPDSGETWGVVENGLTETSVTFDADLLAGSASGIFRVLASDGFHMASDDSDKPFVVPSHAPDAYILPPTREMLVAGNMLAFYGRGLDKEDGDLADKQLTWVSDVDGELGNGRLLTLSTLTPGSHILSLKAVDLEGNETTVAIEIFIIEVAQNSFTANE